MRDGPDSFIRIGLTMRFSDLEAIANTLSDEFVDVVLGKLVEANGGLSLCRSVAHYRFACRPDCRLDRVH
jgi:hypothetical protein